MFYSNQATTGRRRIIQLSRKKEQRVRDEIGTQHIQSSLCSWHLHYQTTWRFRCCQRWPQATAMDWSKHGSVFVRHRLVKCSFVLHHHRLTDACCWSVRCRWLCTNWTAGDPLTPTLGLSWTVRNSNRIISKITLSLLISLYLLLFDKSSWHQLLPAQSKQTESATNKKAWDLFFTAVSKRPRKVSSTSCWERDFVTEASSSKFTFHLYLDDSDEQKPMPGIFNTKQM